MLLGLHDTCHRINVFLLLLVRILFWIILLILGLRITLETGLPMSSVVLTVLHKILSLARLMGRYKVHFCSISDAPSHVSAYCSWSYNYLLCWGFVFTTSSAHLQLFLDSFYQISVTYGLIVSPQKSWIFSCCPLATLLELTVGDSINSLCSHYCYPGAPVQISEAFLPQYQPHLVVCDLLDHLQHQLWPLQWLTSNSSVISISVARTVHVTFICSVVDCLSLPLILFWSLWDFSE